MLSVRNFLKIILTFFFSIAIFFDLQGKDKEYDIVIYGGTSAGISAAIQSLRMGKTVVLIEPSSRIGGLTTGGLGATDIGNKQVIGGISREFYRNIKKYYEKPENWKWQKPEEYNQNRKSEGEDAMWTFEPSAALNVFQEMLSKEKVEVAYRQRLNRQNGVKKGSGQIVSITMESGETYRGKMFIDATYEGDLMAAAGVSYSVGRESNSQFIKPEGYNELDYELLFRNFEAGEKDIPWINLGMPNRKTDTNNGRGFSTDYIGFNYAYPEASYEEREKIIEAHRNYQKGLMWTLANHPRVPEKIREEVSRWGTCKDEFEEEGGWPEQLYVREARRMIGKYVMTQKNCERLEIVEDPVGMAAYGMDSHHVKRYVTANGFVKNEGNVEAHVRYPYPISYRSIVPKKEECVNLLVPVSLSSTHIAYGSIRMEPVFMILGQSAATAAALAIDNGVTLSSLDYKILKDHLLEDKQILCFDPK